VCRSGFLTQKVGQQVFPAVHPRRQVLHHQDVAISIDNQPRQSIRFPVDEAKGRGPSDDPLTQPDGLREAPSPKLLSDGLIVEGQNAHTDLGRRIVETPGVESSVRRYDIDHIAGYRITLDLPDRTGIDPKMPLYLGCSSAREADTPSGTVIRSRHCILIQWRERNVNPLRTDPNRMIVLHRHE
jgi:hypothetical protein